MRLASVARSGSGDPFAESKGLISDVVARLEDEAAADAKEKAFCDNELSATEAKKAENSRIRKAIYEH